MFYGCSSLSSLPDISKLNTNNITNMSLMFALCSSLSSLPDISKWNINKAIKFKYLFGGCLNIIIPKKINKLEIKLKGILNITSMSYMFDGCSSLSSLPDISKWNTNNVTNMSDMFVNCNKLQNIPKFYKK